MPGVGMHVRVAREHDHAVIAVADDGPGIPAEALPHIFDRQFKADRSRSGQGSGLGLAIARENARLLGGDITATSTPGAGIGLHTAAACGRIVTRPRSPRGRRRG